MTGYGDTFAEWRAAAGNHWSAYTRHAFVEGLRDGSLPPTAFLDYLVQDYLFLIHFSRAWALAVTKADTVDEMRLAAATVNAPSQGSPTFPWGRRQGAGLYEVPPGEDY